MLPLGNDQGSVLLYGLLLVVFVLITAYRTRNLAHPIIVGTIACIGVSLLVYAVLVLLVLLSVGTDGYQTGTFWVLNAIGLVPASVFGLVEGFAATLIFRLLAPRSEALDTP